MVKTGQMSAHDIIQEGVPFNLMQLNTDSLERKASARVTFPFLVLKHYTGLQYELHDHPLSTNALSTELQQCLCTALDKILLLCEGFPAGSDEVYVLRNFACIIPQLLFVYGTRTEQVRRTVNIFNQGKWEDLWKILSQENQRRSPPTHLHTVASSSRQILHTHLHHRSITQGIQTTTWRLLLLQSRCNRTPMRTSYSHEDRHRPTQAPPQKPLSPRPRPLTLSHSSTRTPPRLITVYHITHIDVSPHYV